MTFAVPGFVSMISNNRISANINDFVGALQFAKAESASRLLPVTICKRNAAGSGCLRSGNWQLGWIVFADANGNAGVDQPEEVLLIHDALDDRITFKGTVEVSSFITYRPSGFSSTSATAVLVMCDNRGFANSAKAVLITITGRGQVMKAAESGQTTCL